MGVLNDDDDVDIFWIEYGLEIWGWGWNNKNN